MTGGDPEIHRMARRIRRAREEAGLTLQELARRSDLAPSTIQKVETLQMVPTVTVLVKIARGLQRRPGDFIHDEIAELEVVHLREKERHRIGMRRRMSVERLSGDIVDAGLEVWRVTHQPGSGSGAGELCFDGEVVVVLESGRLVFSVGGTDHALRAGDTLHFRATLPHRWKNPGPEPVRFLYIGTLPPAVRAAVHERLRQGDSKGGRS